MSDDAVFDHAGAVHRRDAARVVRLVMALAFIVALVLVGLDNRTKVRVGYVFGERQAPVWVVVLVSAAVGMLVAALLRRRRS